MLVQAGPHLVKLTMSGKTKILEGECFKLVMKAIYHALMEDLSK